MSYSFFGTCCNDHPQLFGCLKTIMNQSISPERIILVDSGDVNIEQEILQTIKKNKIKLVYIFKKMSRVESLNLALDMSFSKYSFRFDSRSRSAKDYAKNALHMHSDENLNIDVVGGVPTVIKSSNNFESKVCAEIMESSYLYFFPKHRNTKFNGYSSSIYLGCFPTKILKNIRFNEKDALISEDSLIIHDFLEKGFKAYISSNIQVSYVCRDSFLNILKLFYTYGYCRANTILVSKKLFISFRHFFVLSLPTRARNNCPESDPPVVRISQGLSATSTTFDALLHIVSTCLTAALSSSPWALIAMTGFVPNTFSNTCQPSLVLGGILESFRGDSPFCGCIKDDFQSAPRDSASRREKTYWNI